MATREAPKARIARTCHFLWDSNAILTGPPRNRPPMVALREPRIQDFRTVKPVEARPARLGYSSVPRRNVGGPFFVLVVHLPEQASRPLDQPIRFPDPA